MDQSAHRRSEHALESVWDFPTPPAVRHSRAHCQVIHNGFLIADSTRTLRVLRTGQPPLHFFPPEDVLLVYMVATRHEGRSDDVGVPAYYDVLVGDRCSGDGAFTYRRPRTEYDELRDRLVFLPSRVDACFLDGEAVRPDYAEDVGGWITPGILGLSRGYPSHWHRQD